MANHVELQTNTGYLPIVMHRAYSCNHSGVSTHSYLPLNEERNRLPVWFKYA